MTVSFLILLASQCISQCLYMLEHGKLNGEETDVWRLVDKSFAVAKLGVIVNSSINCLLYCITGSIFRMEIKKLFKRLKSCVFSSCCPRKNSSSLNLSSSDVVIIGDQTQQSRGEESSANRGKRWWKNRNNRRIWSFPA